MKRLFLIIVFSVLALKVFAQFPLGSSKESIAAYFAGNVQYASFHEFKTPDGIDAFCYTKTRILGDYTLYFNEDGACSTFVETYDRKALNEIIWRYDRKFCRVSATEWIDEDNSVQITLVPHPQKGANYVSITYKPVEHSEFVTNTLAVN
jgi:hypothetical protein